MTVRSLYVCDVLHRRFHHLCGMLPPKRSRTGTGPTTLQRDLEQGICRSCRAQSSVCAGHVRGFQADLELAEQMIDMDARGQLPVKRVKRSTHSCRGVCAHSVRIAVTVASPWPRLCEALVTAFASNSKARLDQKCSDCDVNNCTVLKTINYCWR